MRHRLLGLYLGDELRDQPVEDLGVLEVDGVGAVGHRLQSRARDQLVGCLHDVLNLRHNPRILIRDVVPLAEVFFQVVKLNRAAIRNPDAFPTAPLQTQPRASSPLADGTTYFTQNHNPLGVLAVNEVGTGMSIISHSK